MAEFDQPVLAILRRNSVWINAAYNHSGFSFLNGKIDTNHIERTKDPIALFCIAF
jgi:hypothetical protein